ncbi:type II toxin-antitoxin system VapC family toxin [Altericista sp. CCNU0014]|uniref:type II toxin-antitoxin system VapC family toxin n=1 Tax=Altericista sp. CCNU0014 TaxID=3082949 RepID=UPI00384E6D48
MIAVDTNVIAYLLIQGEHTAQAELVWIQDSEWAAPKLWRSEFRSIIALYLRQAYISLEDARQLMGEAEALMQGKEYEVASDQVLNLVNSSRCSAYDCEFVAIALDLEVRLVTSDRKILTEFPNVAIRMQDFTLQS